MGVLREAAGPAALAWVYFGSEPEDYYCSGYLGSIYFFTSFCDGVSTILAPAFLSGIFVLEDTGLESEKEVFGSTLESTTNVGVAGDNFWSDYGTTGIDCFEIVFLSGVCFKSDTKFVWSEVGTTI